MIAALIEYSSQAGRGVGLAIALIFLLGRLAYRRWLGSRSRGGRGR